MTVILCSCSATLLDCIGNSIVGSLQFLFMIMNSLLDLPEQKEELLS